MTQLMLSNNLGVIESEIKMYKEHMGRSLWEIGRRLNHVKEQDLVHGEFINWLDTVGIDRRKANRMMRIAKELKGNETTLSHLGISALELIASLPEEQRETPQLTSEGALKHPSDMTVNELRSLTAKESDNHPTRNKEPVDKQSAVQREQESVQVKVLQSELAAVNNKLNQVNQQYEEVLQRESESKKKADELDRLKQHIELNKSELEKIEDEVAKTLNFTEVKREVDTLLLKFSPLKYQADLNQNSINQQLLEQYHSVVNQVNEWCLDMYQLLNKPSFIDGQFEEL